MKKLMLYLSGEEYQKIRQEAFDDKKSMNQWVKDILFKGKVKVSKKDVDNAYKEVKKREKKVNKKYVPAGTPCSHGIMWHKGCHYE